MTGIRQQPSRRAKDKAPSAGPVSTGGAGSPPRVAKRPATKKAAAKKAATKKTGPPSKKRKASSTKVKAPASLKRAKTTTNQDRTDDTESEAGAVTEEPPPIQAAGSDENIGAERQANLRQEDRPQANVEDSDADNVGTGEVADRPDDSLAEESRVEPLAALATSNILGACIFRDHEAELAVALKVFNDPDNVSRIGYYAKFRLTVPDADATDELIDGKTIGHILAWRISKPTTSLPNVGNAWLDEILAADPVDDDMDETSLCMLALFDHDGTVKPIVGANINQLNQHPLMFIEMIYIHEDFQGNRLLQPTLDLFYSAIAQLPEWFAFAGTLVLVPAKPGGYKGNVWKGWTWKNVENRLIQIYGRHGFVPWIRNVESRDNEIVSVMGRTLP